MCHPIIPFFTEKIKNTRVGRTARAGRGGLAITLVGERDVELLQAIESFVNVKMTAFEGIDEEEVLKSMNRINMARRAGMLRVVPRGDEVRNGLCACVSLLSLSLSLFSVDVLLCHPAIPVGPQPT